MRPTRLVIGILPLFVAGLSAQEGWRGSLDGTVFLQYARTFDTRGAYQFGSVNRVMFEARGPWAGGTLRAHVMGSAEPLTLGDRGAPQLLQVAFTSDGKTITDHAHPSPWIMELAGSYERMISSATVSLFAAAIGEPALGPPVYLHRASAEANPVVPLAHHAQDETHSSFGVVTLGVHWRGLRLETSAFNDRLPVEPSTVFSYRGARLDAYSARATVAAGGKWSVFGYYGYVPATSGGHVHDSQHRVGTGAMFTDSMWAVTLVYGFNDPLGSGGPQQTLLAEAERHWSDRDVVFARAEYVQRTAQELSLVGSVNAIQDVSAVQVGYGRTVARRAGIAARLGASGTINIVPPQLEAFYGGRTPMAVAAYLQLGRVTNRGMSSHAGHH